MNEFKCVKCGRKLNRVYRAESEVTGGVCRDCYAGNPIEAAAVKETPKEKVVKAVKIAVKKKKKATK